MRRDAVLFLSGVNLILIQFAMTRCLSSVFLGTEVVLFLIVFSYFMGFSAGYFLCDRMGPRGLLAFGLAQWLTHLTLPFSPRWLAGTLASWDMRVSALAACILLGGFWVSAFYSLLLPRLLLEQPDAGPRGFARRYGAEVAGALTGALLIPLACRLPPPVLMVIYQAVLACLLALLWRSRPILLGGLALCGLYAALFPRLEAASVAYAHRTAHGGGPARVLLSRDTPYQRMEILEEDGRRQLYLDGILHYGTDSLSRYNYFIGGLPTALLRPQRTLIVGSGSFGSAAWAAESSAQVTVVELDAAVARAGRSLLAEPGAAEPRLVIDDAKHYMANATEPADVVALDVAGPFQRQVALLYSREFFGLVRSRLSPGGVLSLCLNGDLADRGYTAARIALTLLAEFSDVFVIVLPGGEPSFALAGDGVRFDRAAVARALRAAGHRDALVLGRAEVERRLRGVPFEPISLRHMDIPLVRGLFVLQSRFLRRGGGP